MGGGLFGGRRVQANKMRRDQPPPVDKKYFMSSDYNSGKDFLEGIGIDTHKFECIHNVGSLQGVFRGTLFICPGSDEKEGFTEIMSEIDKLDFRCIYLIDVHTKDKQ